MRTVASLTREEDALKAYSDSLSKLTTGGDYVVGPQFDEDYPSPLPLFRRRTHEGYQSSCALFQRENQESSSGRKCAPPMPTNSPLFATRSSSRSPNQSSFRSWLSFSGKLDAVCNLIPCYSCSLSHAFAGSVPIKWSIMVSPPETFLWQWYVTLPFLHQISLCDSVDSFTI